MERLAYMGNFKHFVKTYETFECADNHYMVMEFVEDGSLSSYLEKNVTEPICEFFAKRVIRQVASALLCLHRMHVIHRDVKLDNILAANSGHKFKLCDFGTAIQLTGPGATANC
mmetsp:Transcript_34382/g.45263  ORF Transcript_34382/g.45263 Transcript_34382/m.45263 type:complete len:114 (+) Transcript_34382:609-950(+)